MLNDNLENTGERALNTGHKTMYVIYNGIDNSTNISEEIKIIGETWNCGIWNQ